MKAKWKSLKSNNLSFLIIEAGPSIKEIFMSNDFLKKKGVLILGIDGPGILDLKDREIISEQLMQAGIPFKTVNSFIWISGEFALNVFEKTEFGTSGDSCIFLDENMLSKNSLYISNIKKLPGETSFVKNKLPSEFSSLFEENPELVYCFNDVPDLLIATRNVNYLKFLESQIKV